MGSIKFPVTGVGDGIGFAIAVILVIAAAKKIPVVKSLV